MRTGRFLLPLVMLTFSEAGIFNAVHQKNIKDVLQSYREEIMSEELEKIEWSDKLAQEAEKKIKDGCHYRSSLKEGMSGGRLYGLIGFYGSMHAWNGEGKTYNFEMKTCSGEWGCANFINTMCNKTKSVGCALKNCTQEIDKEKCKNTKKCTDKVDCEYGGCVKKGDASGICLFEPNCYQKGVEWPNPYYLPTYKPSPVDRRQKERKIPVDREKSMYRKKKLKDKKEDKEKNKKEKKPKKPKEKKPKDKKPKKKKNKKKN